LKKLGFKEEKDKLSSRSLASLQVMYFEETVEDKLWQPTFICEHPVEISPLARASDTHPDVTERFELYITGREFGNGFSELNDAETQAARFHAQVAAKDSGDDEAMFYDHDFVRALEYGMPPTGGCGIGIDRLMETYLKKGYSKEWVNQRLKSIEVRKDLTDEWENRGVKKGQEYAILTDEITKAWSGLSVKEYKNIKDLKKENLRDNMSNLELVLNMLAEATTTEISKEKKPKTFSQSKTIANQG
jgi:hypothetical protein